MIGNQTLNTISTTPVGLQPITQHLLTPGQYLVLLTNQSVEREQDGYDISAYFMQVVSSNPLFYDITDASLAAGTTRGPGLMTSTGISTTVTASVFRIPATMPYNIYHFGIHVRTTADALAPPEVKFGIFYPAGQQVNGYAGEIPPSDALTDVFSGIPATFTGTGYFLTGTASVLSLMPLPTTVTELFYLPLHEVLFAIRNDTSAAITPRYIIYGQGYSIRIIKDRDQQEHILRYKHPYIFKYGTYRPVNVAYPDEWGEARRLGRLFDIIDEEITAKPMVELR